MPILLMLFKASLLLAAALVAARLLRRAPAATRHALWSATFAALLALPVLAAVVPVVGVPVPAGWFGTASTAQPEPARRQEASGSGQAVTFRGNVVLLGDNMRAGASAAPETGFAPPSLGSLARLLWLAGAVAAAGALLLSLFRVGRLARSATPVTDPAWRAAVDGLAARLGLRGSARLVMSHAVRTPMAGGVWRPLIFLPADASSWSDGRRDVVLAHELSHLAGLDPLRHIAARLAVACYWFHPLAWVAARQSTLAREQACDEAVLALGVRPSDYARVLLDLAETMAPARPAAAALPMIERSLLETRLMAILEHDGTSSRLRRSFVPAAATALLTLTLAAAQPAARRAEAGMSVPPAPAPQATSAPSPLPADSLVAAAPSAHGLEGITQLAHAFAAVTQSTQTGECWSLSRGNSFTGTTIDNGAGFHIIQQRFGDLGVCMIAQGVTGNEDSRPSVSAGRAARVHIETVRGASTASLETRRQGGTAQTTWKVNGAERPFDASAQAWRDALLSVLDRTWEISALRGEESSLRGDISSLRGEESSLRGDISSLMGEISSLRGEQSALRGEESSLRGEISSIQGHVSSLRGEISSERGSISALEASRYDLSQADRERLAAQIRTHEREIERIEKELLAYDAGGKIADVEKQIRALDTERKLAALEKDIAAFGEAGKIAAIEKEIQALNVDRKTAEIERRISALDVERRTRQMESQMEEALRRLERALAAIR